VKLIFVVSSLDLTQPFSATPSWWQLLKAFYEIGVDVIVTPYQGPAIESPWWRAAPNPAKWQGDLFRVGREAARRVLPARSAAATPARRGEDAATVEESASDRVLRQVARRSVGTLWRNHLDRLLRTNPDALGVIVLTAPLNHLTGIPGQLERKHGRPFFYYDGDAPASLPRFSGFASGFRIYQGGDLAEYAAVISNSKGSEETLTGMGARAVHTVYYAADPELFAPVEVGQQDIDVLFYGHGSEYRSGWVDAMIARPSYDLPEARFAVRGTKLGDIGRARELPYLSFSALREYACRSRVNLCITRQAHASVYGSSTARPFELAGMGSCIVSNPYEGVGEWFEPGTEIIVVESAEEATERYRWLLAHDAERRAIGDAARRRLLGEHTFRHRARQLLDIVKSYQ
jgi:hypothetical protein